MKLIILDHLRRRWLILVVLCFAYFGSEWLTIEIDSHVPADHGIFDIGTSLSWPVLILTGLLLTFDLFGGIARVLVGMPVTARQIGRAWWLVCVALPATAFVGTGILALLIFSHGATVAVHWEGHLTNWVSIVLILGAFFGALTFARTPEISANSIGARFSNVLLMLPILGWVYLRMGTPTQAQAELVFVGLAVLAVAGWFRAEQLVIRRAGARVVSQPPGTKPAKHVAPRGFGGTPFLLQTMSLRIVYEMVFIPVFLLAVFGVLRWVMMRQVSIENLLNSFGASAATFLPVFVLMSLLFPLVLHLRSLRTLPISISALAALMVFLPTAAMLAIGLTMGALGAAVSGHLAGWLIPQNYIITAALLAICVPMLVWRGIGTEGFGLVFFVIMVGGTFPLILGATKVPLLAVVAVGGVLVGLSFFLTRRLLRQGSQAYRVRTTATFGWQGMGR